MNVLITFDDFRSADFDTIFGITNPLSISATSYHTTDWINTEGFLTTEQLTTLDADGWAIANHSKTHTNFGDLTEAEIVTELTSARDALNALGLTKASRHHAYPYGAWNLSKIISAIKTANMLTGRTTDANLCDYTVNRHQIPSYAPTNLSSAQDVIDFVETARAGKYFAVICFHRIVETPTEAVEFSTANFTTVVNYLSTNAISVITIDEMHDLYLKYYA